ncbi:MAG: FAD-binding oxidoreductase [Woeseia sp.]
MRDHRYLTRRALLARGAALGGLAMIGSPSALLAQAASQAAATGGKTLEGLGAVLRGETLMPADGGYDSARQLWNGMIDKRPAAIARCGGVADVVNLVEYARENNHPISVRGGGHSVSGKAARDGAIMMDLSQMRAVRVDPVKKSARAEGGATWADFDHETLAFDLTCTGGTVSSTGIGGLTLGGGLGWLMRKHGLACDDLVSADVVTADARFLTASATENPDLFWALRGGGGNFGVVTSFEFGLHELEPVIGGLAIYPQDKLEDMLHFFKEFTANAPDSVTTMAGVLYGPPGSPVEGQSAGWIGVCHSGPVNEGKRALSPIDSFATPALGSIAPLPYSSLQTMFDAGSPAGNRNYWRSNFMTDLHDDVIDIIHARTVDGLPNMQSLILIEHMGGAVARVGDHETAFSNRAAKYNVSVMNGWSDAADDAANIGWTRSFGDQLKAYATGAGYVNYMMDDESAERVRATYQANLERLREVKRKYDPDNFFNVNQNIAP